MTAQVVLRVVWEGATAFCLVAGAFFALVGAIGLVRLPDTFMRFHAPTKATTLGVGGILAGSLLYFAGSGRLVVHEKGAEGHRAIPAAGDVCSTSGSRMRATVACCSRTRSSEASPPKWPRSRSRTLRKPKLSPLGGCGACASGPGPVSRTSSVTPLALLNAATSMRPGVRCREIFDCEVEMDGRPMPLIIPDCRG